MHHGAQVSTIQAKTGNAEPIELARVAAFPEKRNCPGFAIWKRDLRTRFDIRVRIAVIP